MRQARWQVLDRCSNHSASRLPTRSGSGGGIWPPVTGPATAGPGVTGKLGKITRSDGSIQALYDGHPLYTYTADTAPGQANGNGINASGGVWHEVTASGAPGPPPARQPAPAAGAATDGADDGVGPAWAGSGRGRRRGLPGCWCRAPGLLIAAGANHLDSCLACVPAGHESAALAELADFPVSRLVAALRSRPVTSVMHAPHPPRAVLPWAICCPAGAVPADRRARTLPPGANAGYVPGSR